MPEFISTGAFRAIPGYNNNYYINLFGVVANRRGHILTPTITKRGPTVDLRNNGQRERVLVSELLEKVMSTYDCERVD